MGNGGFVGGIMLMDWLTVAGANSESGLDVVTERK